MTRPNYNLIRFIRRCISQMKREYGSPITVYNLDSAATDLKTGAKTVSRSSVYIPRAVVMPVKLTRDAVQSISLISANKKVVQGGTFDVGTRTFIIDRRDAPGLTMVADDWIVYDGKRYDIKVIEEFEQGTAWMVMAREIERVVPQEDIHLNTNDYVLELTDEVTYTMARHWCLDVADAFGLSDIADTLLV